MKQIKENESRSAYFKIGIDNYRLSSQQPLMEDIADDEMYSECKRSNNKKGKPSKAQRLVERPINVPCGASDNDRANVSEHPLVQVQETVKRRQALQCSGYKRARNRKANPGNAPRAPVFSSKVLPPCARCIVTLRRRLWASTRGDRQQGGVRRFHSGM